ncbi:MAG: hypothetical protein MRZ79_12440 [Bacteroidia bacterium]|nr:hypothetical protein [Bacteroidia bacterium]
MNPNELREAYHRIGLLPGKAYYKYELAEVIGVHKGTLARYLKFIEAKLREISPYSRRKQILSPLQVQYILRHLGYL